MNQILVIAWREVTRLRKRFGGGGSPLTVLVLLGVLGFTSYTLRDSVSLGNGLYRVGVSGDVPAINDSRFSVMEVSPEDGQVLLTEKKIDLLIVDAQVFTREDDKSQFAERAMKQYMEKEELVRVGNSFAQGEAFPLRVGINYLGAEQPSAGNEAVDVLIQGANHFAIAHPLDETTGRFFLDMEMTRPAGQVRGQIAGLVLAFIKKSELQTEQTVIRKK